MRRMPDRISFISTILLSVAADTLALQQDGAQRVNSKKEGRNGPLRRFQQLGSYGYETETRNRQLIHFSSRIVRRGRLVAERS